MAVECVHCAWEYLLSGIFIIYISFQEQLILLRDRFDLLLGQLDDPTKVILSAG